MARTFKCVFLKNQFPQNSCFQPCTATNIVDISSICPIICPSRRYISTMHQRQFIDLGAGDIDPRSATNRRYRSGPPKKLIRCADPTHLQLGPERQAIKVRMSLLKCIELEVFLLQAPKGDGVGAKEEVVPAKRPLQEACKGKRKEASS